jgi:hypothetical protein
MSSQQRKARPHRLARAGVLGTRHPAEAEPLIRRQIGVRSTRASRRQHSTRCRLVLQAGAAGWCCRPLLQAVAAGCRLVLQAGAEAEAARCGSPRARSSCACCASSAAWAAAAAGPAARPPPPPRCSRRPTPTRRCPAPPPPPAQKDRGERGGGRGA